MHSLFVNFAIFFLIYLIRPKWGWALFCLAFGVGLQIWSFQYYFRGGWEAAGNTHPFNAEFMFSSVVLGGLASIVGFAARAVDLKWMSIPKRRVFRIASYGVFLAVFALGAWTATIAIPLSFERPIDLALCDLHENKPYFCDLVAR